MELVTPVTLVVDGADLTINTLDLIIIDDSARKFIVARLHPVLRPLPLWRGEEYDAAGDWTQEQAEERILELLGSDIQAGLQALVLE
jgi:hypothetical protein